MSLKALVVDDEAPARIELAYLLREIPDVEVVAQAGSGPEACKLLLVLEPQVVFLDVQMPKMDGFAVARRILQLPEPRPPVVFVTAYDQYAIQAFEVNALDYLLKPISPARLQEAVGRVRARLAVGGEVTRQLQALQTHLQKLPRVQKVPVEKGGRIMLLDPAEIAYAYCQGKKVLVRTAAGEFLTRLTLQELEDRLGHPFWRVHKGYVVNLERVKEIIPWFQGNYFLVLRDGKDSQVPVGRQKIKEVKELLGL